MEDSLPTVRIAVLLPKGFLGQLHLRSFADLEKVLCHAEHVIMAEAQGSIGKIRKASGCKDIEELFSKSGEFFFAQIRARQQGEVDDW